MKQFQYHCLVYTLTVELVYNADVVSLSLGKLPEGDTFGLFPQPVTLVA